MARSSSRPTSPSRSSTAVPVNTTRRRSALATTESRELLSPKIRDLFFRPGRHGQADYIPSRYKVAYGGRGGAKTWGFAGLAVTLGAKYVLRFLCTREYQSSIKESVHQILASRIIDLGLSPYYIVQNDAIYGRLCDAKGRRTAFVFAGLKTDPAKVKGTEDIDVCWVEEAEKVSKRSWTELVPTVRNKYGRHAEVWVVFNPADESDATYQRFVLKSRPNLVRIVKVNWRDNPWFPADLDLDRRDLLQDIAEATDDDERAQLQADYDHIWEGECQRRTDASVFRRRVVVEEFGEPPAGTRLYFGADWGFANDPTALMRFWLTKGERGDELWVSHEAYAPRVEMDELPAFFSSVPGARQWPIKADAADPRIISYLARNGFKITAAKKWPGSLEDGIAYLKSFKRIHIHARCTHLQDEARLYSYKVDRITQEVLPIVVDKFNHGWDAIRYGLDDYITQPVGGFFNTRRLVS